jgi:hypothetical protein
MMGSPYSVSAMIIPPMAAVVERGFCSFCIFPCGYVKSAASTVAPAVTERNYFEDVGAIMDRPRKTLFFGFPKEYNRMFRLTATDFALAKSAGGSMHRPYMFFDAWDLHFLR